MGLIQRLRDRKADSSWLGRMGATWSESGGTDSMISEFSGEDRELLVGFDGSMRPPATLFETQHAVNICVRFLARNIAHTALKVYRRGEGEQAPEHLPDHALSKLLNRPNPRTDRFILIQDTVADMALYGDAFWWKARAGDTRQLIRIPPAFCSPQGGNIFTGPEFYKLTDGTELAPSEIVHFRDYNPTDPRTGTSRLRALRSVLREELEASRHRANFWRKGARMSGFIKRQKETPWSDDAYKRFTEGLKKFSRGGEREGEWFVLEDSMEPDSLAFSPKEAEYLEGRDWALDIVATAYDIPLPLLSRTATPTFASLKEFHKVLYVDTLGPWNAMIEGAIWLQLIPEFDDEDLYVEFNIAEKLQGDFEQTSNAFRQSTQVPVLSVNRSLKILNQPPVGDPEDPENPYNYPARPKNYEYGPPSEADETAPAPAVPLQRVPDEDDERIARAERLIMEAR